MTAYLAPGIVLFVARISTALALLPLGLVAIAGSAQDAPQSPAISVSSRLVQVGVIAHDKNGPVADLTKDDFVVLDRGKPQKIAVFSIESSQSASQPAMPLPQNTISDLPEYGASTPRSVTIVLLDNLNTLYGSAAGNYETTPYWMEDLALANAKTYLIEFIKQLSPQDRVAIYGLRDSLQVLCDFTSDRGIETAHSAAGGFGTSATLADEDSAGEAEVLGTGYCAPRSSLVKIFGCFVEFD